MNIINYYIPEAATTILNTRLAAFLQLSKHIFNIYGFLRWSSV